MTKTGSVPLPEASVDLVAIGETMIMMTPTDGKRLEHAETMSVHLGGAESNVATYLADLGHRVRWAGGVGADPFGRMVIRELGAAGVDTSAAYVNPAARTGVYFKDPEGTRTTVHYYRGASAAAQLGPEILSDPRLAGARAVHFSGITAALSPSCLELLRAAILRRALSPSLVSFDVNHRPALWPTAVAGPVLSELADASDLVFVGLDESRMLWGCESAADVRTKLPNAGCLVVKDDARGAESLSRGSSTFVPSPRVDVVEAVGAGDAFAAGYLSGLLNGLDEERRLRLGHLVAAQALSVTSDHAPLPSPDWFLRHVGLSSEDWAQLDFLPSARVVN
jgi:2-dehydro-3-deoxygluconokinase